MFAELPIWGWVLVAVVAQLELFAAREPIHQGIRLCWSSLTRGLRFFAAWFRGLGRELQNRNQEMLLVEATRQHETLIDRELERLSAGFGKELAKFPATQRKLEEVVSEIRTAVDQCSDAPLEVPGWPDAAEKILAMPEVGESSRKRLIAEVKQLARESEKKSLHTFRAECSKRHKVLATLAPKFIKARELLRSVGARVDRALETTNRIDGLMDRYEKLRRSDAAITRTVLIDHVRLFVISAVVTAVAVGGALVNFHLIAVPMAELVPTSAQIAGTPVPLVAALVIVLMEAAAGIFVLEALGVTEMLPRVGQLSRGKRRLVFITALFALIALAGVEASLAVLRENIVESNVALERSLLGAETRADGLSSIPMVGQAVLGFMLPFLLAMVAIPLETLVQSGRYVLTAALAGVLHALANSARLVRTVVDGVAAMSHALFDLTIGIPLLIFRAIDREESTAKSAKTRVLRDVSRPAMVAAGKGGAR
ncbi:MAG: hypothetical protein AAF658_00360 [Myxococcota bacterium]